VGCCVITTVAAAAIMGMIDAMGLVLVFLVANLNRNVPFSEQWVRSTFSKSKG